MASVGIIGFGRFGQLIAKHLSPYHDIYVSNRSDKSEIAMNMGLKYCSLEECSKKDVVIPCVPISQLELVLKKISPFLKKGTLVCDVCSVKVIPANLLLKYVPEDCSCMGTHPLFGPDTTKNGLDGKTIALCPLRGAPVDKAISFLQSIGLRTVVTTPDEHDRQMAHSLALIHFLGNALNKLDINSVSMATTTHELLKELVTITKNDSEELFFDMHRYNPYVKEVRKKLIKELNLLDMILEDDSRKSYRNLEGE